MIFTRKSAPRRPPADTMPLFEAALEIRAETIERARSVAPGYDIHALYHDWRGFALQRGEMPKSPDAAFLGFCRKRHERDPLT